MSQGGTPAGGAGGGAERENKALKTALLVAGGLFVGWLTIETALKPFIEFIRGGFSKSDSSLDPNEDDGGKDVPDADATTENGNVEGKEAPKVSSS